MTAVAGIAAVLAAAFVGVPAVALGLLALAVDGPAAELLAAAAVLAALMPRLGRWAALPGLPGGVAAAAVADEPLLVVIAVTAVVLATHESEPDAKVHIVLVAAGAWLVLAPTTLPWGDGARLGPYQAGVIRALAAGVLAAAALRVLRWRRSHAETP